MVGLRNVLRVDFVGTNDELITLNPWILFRPSPNNLRITRPVRPFLLLLMVLLGIKYTFDLFLLSAYLVWSDQTGHFPKSGLLRWMVCRMGKAINSLNQLFKRLYPTIYSSSPSRHNLSTFSSLWINAYSFRINSSKEKWGMKLIQFKTYWSIDSRKDP